MAVSGIYPQVSFSRGFGPVLFPWVIGICRDAMATVIRIPGSAGIRYA